MPELSELVQSGIIAAVVSVVVAAIVAYFQGRAAAQREVAKRQSDVSIEVTKLLIDGDNTKAVAKRFAVGLIKVLHGPAEGELGLVCFIPVHARVTVGCDAENDLVLAAGDVARLQCGFYSEGRDIYVEDYRSASGTFVNAKKVTTGGSKRLKDGDRVAITDYEIEFQYVHRSKTLTR